MPDYSKTKIYKIVSQNTPNVYIGSTLSSLSQRMSEHRSDFKNRPDKYTSSYEILQYDDAQIVLVENFPCASADERHKREYEVIQLTENCINKLKPLPEVVGLSVGDYQKWYNERNKEYVAARQKQYNEDHKEAILAQQRQAYQQNADRIRAQVREYAQQNRDKIRARKGRLIQCECGATIQHGYKKRHENTAGHLNAIRVQPVEPVPI